MQVDMRAGNDVTKLERRVVEAAEAALADQRHVSAIDVLLGIRWLAPATVDRWRQGRVDHLERVIPIDGDKVSAALAIFRRWAIDRGLVPTETDEREYRTQWASPELSDEQRQRLADKQSRPPELVVISPRNDWTCTACSGTGELLIMDEPGPLCLACADLDHLVFVPAGDAALTRRAKKASRLAAVVVRFSRTRGRYERQGVLVEESALAAAEEACLADAEVRRRRRDRSEAARATEDEAFHAAFAAAVAELFPGCPPERAAGIARHAGARGSGRVGRTAAGRALDEQAVTAAVVASVRHADTTYDDLLMAGVDRADARERVRDAVDLVLDGWRQASDASS